MSATNTAAPPGRRGRRPGVSTTRQDILDAARARFAADGFGRATIRQIAGDAGVDASLVIQSFKSKDELFAAVMSLPADALDRFRSAFDGVDDGVGERVVRAFLAVWEGPAPASEPLMAMLRSAVTTEKAQVQLRDFLQSRLQHGLTSGADPSPEAVTRSGLVASMLVGVVIGRHLVGVPTLTTLDTEALVVMLAPAVQAVLVPAAVGKSARQKSC